MSECVCLCMSFSARRGGGGLVSKSSHENDRIENNYGG